MRQANANPINLSLGIWITLREYLLFAFSRSALIGSITNLIGEDFFCFLKFSIAVKNILYVDLDVHKNTTLSLGRHGLQQAMFYQVKKT